jgi:hypothetical protein
MREMTPKNAHWKTAAPASCAVLAITHLAQAQVRIGERQNQLSERQNRTPDERLPSPSTELSGTRSEPQSPYITVHGLQLQGPESGRFGCLLGQLTSYPICAGGKQ